MGLTYPDLGETAHYSFKSPISAIDGIYTLVKTQSFQSLLDDGISLYDALYAPLDVSEELYDNAWPGYREDTILHLVLADDALNPDLEEKTMYPVPSTLIDGIPDPSVIRVYDLTLSVEMGLFQHPSEIEHAKTQLDDIAASVSGTTETTILMSDRERWMTQTDYAATVSARSGRIEQLDLQSVVIRRQAEENRRLKEKYAALETAYLALAT